MRFSWSDDGERWHRIGGDYDVAQLADDFGGKDSFTGAVVGLCAQDTARQSRAADFAHFRLEAARVESVV